MKPIFAIFSFFCISFYSFNAVAKSPPGLDIYGNLPEIMSVAVSESGNKVVFLRSGPDGEYVIVKDYTSGTQSGFKV